MTNQIITCCAVLSLLLGSCAKQNEVESTIIGKWEHVRTSNKRFSDGLILGWSAHTGYRPHIPTWNINSHYWTKESVLLPYLLSDDGDSISFKGIEWEITISDDGRRMKIISIQDDNTTLNEDHTKFLLIKNGLQVTEAYERRD